MANQFPLPNNVPPSIPESPQTLPPLDSSVPLPPPEENPVIPPEYQAPEPVAAAPIQKSPFRIIVPIAIGIILLGIIVFVIFRIFASVKSTPATGKTATQVVTLNYWGLWDTPAVMKPVIDAFQSENPNIKINYQLQSYQDYQDRLQTAISGQTPPDIASIHSTWLPVYINNLLPAPSGTISPTEINTNFYPFVQASTIINNQVYGVPYAADGLVLFVNTNILKQYNVTAPTTWDDLTSPPADIVKKLTQRDPTTGKITRAAIAMGNTTNVEHWPDIVSLMLLQAGVNLLNPQNKTVSDTLSYYTSFANSGSNSNWDETLPDSIAAFANEKVAMIFAPLWRIPEIQAMNPSLQFDIAPVPQLPESDKVNWISMWMQVVPKSSLHPQEAWKFVSYLASAKAQQLIFDAALKERGSAQVPTNKAVAQSALQNPLTSTMAQSLDTGRTFYTASLTRDSSTGINSRLIKYLENAVNSVSSRQDLTKAVDTMILGFNQVLSQFRLVTPIPVPTGQ